MKRYTALATEYDIRYQATKVAATYYRCDGRERVTQMLWATDGMCADTLAASLIELATAILRDAHTIRQINPPYPKAEPR